MGDCLRPIHIWALPRSCSYGPGGGGRGVVCWASRAFKANKAFVCHRCGEAGQAPRGCPGGHPSGLAEQVNQNRRGIRGKVCHRYAQVRARVPSGSQVHLRACMTMPPRDGAQAEAGATVRVLAYKGAVPLFASLCLSPSLSLLCL